MPRSFFGGMRRGGFGIGISQNKLAQMMLDVLVQLPAGTTDLKNAVVAHMGLVGQMSATRDINAAWQTAKRRAESEHPDKFLLEGKALRWNVGQARPVEKRLSSATLRKLWTLAEKEGQSMDGLVTLLISAYRATKKPV